MEDNPLDQIGTHEPDKEQVVRTPAPAIDLVSRILRAEADLSPAERCVAAAVRGDLEGTTRLTIAELANRAGVSQPSVTRFCRSVGSASFGELKIELATALAVASAYLKSDRAFNDDAGHLARAVMLNAANAIHHGLDQLDTVALARAIDALAAAQRIDIYGQGGASAAIAEDAKLRLFRLGIPVGVFVDGQQQRISAATLKRGDAVVAISNSGRSTPVVDAVDIARSFGATTVAMTRPNTPLASTAEIVIAVTVPEIDDFLRPTASGYAHMAVIDTIATGVAARLGARGRETLRRVRHTLASIGGAIPTPSTDPTPIMEKVQPTE